MPATVELGFSISSEEHPPLEAVRQAVRAEEAGFGVRFWGQELRPALRDRGLVAG